MEAWADALSKCGSAMAFVINDFRGNITKVRAAFEEDKEARNTLKKLVEAEKSKGMHKKNKCADPSGAIGACAGVWFVYGTSWDGVWWDGVWWDGVWWDGVWWDGVWWDGMGWDGMGWDDVGSDGMG